MNEIKLPKCSMAADDDIFKQKREELRKRLANSEPITIGKSGEVGTTPSASSVFIPEGKLADALDDALRSQRETDGSAARREALAKALKEAKPVTLGKGGKVVSANDKEAAFTVPQGKLAALMQWYERDPMLLEAEKAAMRRDFPQFSLIKLDDGRLAWVGDVNLGVQDDSWSWRLMAVYQPNHPVQQMGSSVYVYLVEPSIEYLIEQLFW